MSLPRFVAVAGIIGAGKSTLAGALRDTVGYQLHSEPVLENPYLADFYKDMARWSFPMQVYLLGRRFQQHQQIVWADQPAVQDRSIYEDTIFASMLAQAGLMERRDYECYLGLFAQMAHFLQRPDVVLYLDVSPETALERVRQRGRPEEKSMTLDYLRSLHAAYEVWAERMAPVLKIVRVPWERPSTTTQVLELASRANNPPARFLDAWALENLAVGGRHV